MEEKTKIKEPQPGETGLLRVIARVWTDFPSKFGIPRQPGLVRELEGRVVFEPEFRIPEAVRGIGEFSHLWLIWGFSENAPGKWQPTVRPPRLGGNTRLGVFATRSPFRPNALGLSAVRLIRVEENGPEGPVLVIGGTDMADNTLDASSGDQDHRGDADNGVDNGHVELPGGILDVLQMCEPKNHDKHSAKNKSAKESRSDASVNRFNLVFLVVHIFHLRCYSLTGNSSRENTL